MQGLAEANFKNSKSFDLRMRNKYHVPSFDFFGEIDPFSLHLNTNATYQLSRCGKNGGNDNGITPEILKTHDHTSINCSSLFLLARFRILKYLRVKLAAAN